MDNLSIWDRVEKTDPSTTKETNYGRKITTVCAYHQIKKATEIFGPIGRGWGYRKKLTYMPSDKFPEYSDILLCELEFWYWDENKIGECVFDVASTMAWRGQRWDKYAKPKPVFKAFLDEEAPKKLITDCLTKALSYLGFNSDIFMGKFEDQRYVNERRKEVAEEKVASKTKAQAPKPVVAKNATTQKPMDKALARRKLDLIELCGNDMENKIYLAKLLKDQELNPKCLVEPNDEGLTVGSFNAINVALEDYIEQKRPGEPKTKEEALAMPCKKDPALLSMGYNAVLNTVRGLNLVISDAPPDEMVDIGSIKLLWRLSDLLEDKGNRLDREVLEAARDNMCKEGEWEQGQTMSSEQWATECEAILDIASS